MALETPTIPADSSHETESYRLIQTLTSDRTFLCSDASANIVVLVKLEEDCLNSRQLHPSIRDRLSRVRELPHPRVATLRGVERWEGAACMVWIYLDGETWDDILKQNPLQFPELAAALVATVDALHNAGLVHGNLHGRNIIIRPDDQPWLTHVSPYLYSDAFVDIAAVVGLLRCGGELLPLARRERLNRMLDAFNPAKLSLKELARSLLVIDADEEPRETSLSPLEAPNYHRASLLGATIICVAAIALGLIIRWSISKTDASIPSMLRSIKLEGHR